MRPKACTSAHGESIRSLALGELIGAGASACVHRARDARGATVAVKVFHAPARESDERGSVVLDHENVVRVLSEGHFEHAGHRRRYSVMEYLDGETLRQRLDRDGAFDADALRHVARELVAGLAVLHGRGHLHLDLKPENVMWTREGRVKLTDVSLSPDATHLTPLYAAPECAPGGSEGPDARSDLYSLGMMLYELAVGQHPLAEQSSVQLRGEGRTDSLPTLCDAVDAPPDLSELVVRLMQVEAAARPASADEAAQILTLDGGRPLAAPSAPPPGRSREFAELAEAVRASAQGDGSIHLLVGEAGIGKSHLTRALREATAHEVRWVVSRQQPGGHRSLLAAMLIGVRQCLGVLGGSQRDAVLSAVPAQVKQVLGAVFNEVASSEDQPAIPAPAVHQAVDAVLTALVNSGGLCVNFEDMHFLADEERASVVGWAERLAAAGACVLASTRDAEASLGEDAHVHVLSRLDLRAVRELLVDALGDTETAEQLLQPVVRVSSGLPFLIHGALGTLRDEELLVRSATGTQRLTHRVADVALPASAREAVSHRLRSLAESDLELLELAACAGFVWDLPLLAAVLDRPLDDVREQVITLVERGGLLRREQGAFEFAHHAVLEAIREELPAAVRRALHGGLARALFAGHGEEAMRTARACEHALRGGGKGLSPERIDEAQRQLFAAWESRRQKELLEAALDHPGLLRGFDRSQAWTDLVRSYQYAQRPRAALRAAVQAVRAAQQAGDERLLARTRYALAWAVSEVRGPPQAMRIVEGTLPLVRCGEASAMRASLAGLGTWLSMLLGDVVRRDAFIQEAIEHARPEEPQGRMMAMTWRANGLAFEGKPAEGLALLRAMEAQAVAAGVPDVDLAYLRLELSGLILAAGDPRGSEALVDRVEEDTQRRADARLRELILRRRFNVAASEGHWRAVQAEVAGIAGPGGRQDGKRQGVIQDIPRLHYFVAAGQPAQALAETERFLRTAWRRGERSAWWAAASVKLEVLAHLERWTEALRLTRTIRGQEHVRAARESEYALTIIRVRRLLQCGAGRRAARILERYCDADRWTDWLESQAFESLARCYAAAGLRDEAAAAAIRARDAHGDAWPQRSVRARILLARLGACSVPDALAYFETFGERLEAFDRAMATAELAALAEDDALRRQAEVAVAAYIDAAPAEDRDRLRTSLRLEARPWMTR